MGMLEQVFGDRMSFLRTTSLDYGGMLESGNLFSGSWILSPYLCENLRILLLFRSWKKESNWNKYVHWEIIVFRFVWALLGKVNFGRCIWSEFVFISFGLLCRSKPKLRRSAWKWSWSLRKWTQRRKSGSNRTTRSSVGRRTCQAWRFPFICSRGAKDRWRRRRISSPRPSTSRRRVQNFSKRSKNSLSRLIRILVDAGFLRILNPLFGNNFAF